MRILMKMILKVLLMLAQYNRQKQHKACKKEISKKLMPVAWHPTRQYNWCMPEDEK